MQLELEGWERGTPQFDRALRKRKIIRCLEYQGLESCQVCHRAPFCRLLEEHQAKEKERLEQIAQKRGEKRAKAAAKSKRMVGQKEG